MLDDLAAKEMPEKHGQRFYDIYRSDIQSVDRVLKKAKNKNFNSMVEFEDEMANLVKEADQMNAADLEQIKKINRLVFKYSSNIEYVQKIIIAMLRINPNYCFKDPFTGGPTISLF